MKRGSPGVYLSWLLAGLVGGEADHAARGLLVHSRMPGTLRLWRMGGAGKLLAKGKIDAHRRIPAADGEPLDVWVIGARRAGSPQRCRGTVLLIHGLWDSKARMYTAGARLAAEGYHVVLPDLRAHGRSGGELTTWGARETEDLAAVMAALTAEGLIAGPRQVVGFSMGGGIAVQYAATDPACRGVVALAPVGDTRAILRRLLRVQAPLTRGARVEAIVDRAGELGGFDVDATSAVAVAPRLRCPIVILHGRLDRTVPPAHSQAIHAAAAGPKQLLHVPWAGHNSLLYGRANWILAQVTALAARKTCKK